MTDLATVGAYGVLIEPATLRIQRRLPGPIERVWAFLTESDQRRRWLASGEMTLVPGAAFELVWRNDELTEPPGARPDGAGDEHRMASRILAADPPRHLAFTWQDTGDVTIDLESQGKTVLLTLTHRRLPPRPMLLDVSAGWHMHLDILAARAAGEAPPPFWDGWRALKADYDRRLPA